MKSKWHIKSAKKKTNPNVFNIVPWPLNLSTPLPWQNASATLAWWVVLVGAIKKIWLCFKNQI